MIHFHSCAFGRSGGLAIPAAIAATLLGGSVSCGAPAGPIPSRAAVPDPRPYVTPAVAASIGSDRLFQLDTPTQLPAAQITPSEARDQALAASKTFGPMQRRYLERQRGAEINFFSLRVVRVFYAMPPYEQSLPSTVHRGVRKIAGPFYLVTLADGDVPALSVAVSAYNTDVRVENGSIRYTAVERGDEFRMQGIRVDVGDAQPVSPERAVQIASEFANALVVDVPELVLPSTQFVPQRGRWRIRLEKPVLVRGLASQLEREVSEVFVGMDRVVLMARAGSSEPALLYDPNSRESIQLSVLPGYQTAFERVSAIVK